MNKEKKEGPEKQEKDKEQDVFRNTEEGDNEFLHIPALRRDKAYKEGEETTSTGPRATGENEKQSENAKKSQ